MLVRMAAMNNFPAMTDERRDSLIDWAKGYINAAEIYVASNPADRSGKAYLELLQIALAALNAPPAPVLRVPDGWALVPVEPTEDMLAAAKEWFGLTTTAEGVYEKMLAAAPEASNEQ